MSSALVYCLSMAPKRTTIEIDQDLLQQAKQALDVSTARAAVDGAVRLAADGGPHDVRRRVSQHRAYPDALSADADLDVLGSGMRWRSAAGSSTRVPPLGLRPSRSPRTCASSRVRSTSARSANWSSCTRPARRTTTSANPLAIRLGGRGWALRTGTQLGAESHRHNDGGRPAR